jgi:hypothetical protein
VCDFGSSTELVRLDGVSISLEKNFYRLPFTPPLSGRLIGPSNLLSLDASLAIPTRVLRFEDSGLHRCTPVRPVLLTSQTGTH